jgi:3'5'-cyclic nucleotide phosphodiesterase
VNAAQGDGKQCNVLSHLEDPNEYKSARKCVVKAILSTDMAHHADMCRYFK